VTLTLPADPVLLSTMPEALTARPGSPGEILLSSDLEYHRFATDDLQPGDEWVAAMYSPTLSPGGEWIAWVGSPPRESPSLLADPAETFPDGIWVQPTDGGEAWNAATVTFAADDLAIESPGLIHAITARSTYAEVWPRLDPDRRVVIEPEEGGYVFLARLNPSGSLALIAIEYPDRNEYLVHEVGGESWVVDSASWDGGWWTSDFITDDQVAITSDVGVRFVNVRTGETLEAAPAPVNLLGVGLLPDGSLRAASSLEVLDYSFDTGTWTTVSGLDPGVDDRWTTLLASEGGVELIAESERDVITRGRVTSTGSFDPGSETVATEAGVVAWDPTGRRLLALGHSVDSLAVIDDDRVTAVPHRSHFDHVFWLDADHLGSLDDRAESTVIHRLRIDGGEWEELVEVDLVTEARLVAYDPATRRVVVVDGGGPFVVRLIGLDGSVRSIGPIDRIPIGLVAAGHRLVDQLGPVVFSYGADGNIFMHTTDSPPATIAVGVSDLSFGIQATLVPGDHRVALIARFQRRGPRLQTYTVGSVLR